MLLQHYVILYNDEYFLCAYKILHPDYSLRRCITREIYNVTLQHTILIRVHPTRYLKRFCCIGVNRCYDMVSMRPTKTLGTELSNYFTSAFRRKYHAIAYEPIIARAITIMLALKLNMLDADIIKYVLSFDALSR